MRRRRGKGHRRAGKKKNYSRKMLKKLRLKKEWKKQNASYTKTEESSEEKEDYSKRFLRSLRRKRCSKQR
jgi:hypothetical protein